jgi:hypothetical protein
MLIHYSPPKFDPRDRELPNTDPGCAALSPCHCGACTLAAGHDGTHLAGGTPPGKVFVEWGDDDAELIECSRRPSIVTLSRTLREWAAWPLWKPVAVVLYLARPRGQ